MPVSPLEPEQNVFAVVILGSFNPQIFHPLWYADNELIAREEVNDVKDLLCSDEISAFVLNEVHFQIERHRFGLTTKDASRALSLRDLAVNTFTILEHTPLTAIGLNRDMRFRLENSDLWHSIGHQLAPKAKWDGIIESPGMRIVAMEGQRKECNAEKVSIRVQPAGGVENIVLIAVNQHYSLKDDTLFWQGGDVQMTVRSWERVLLDFVC